MRDTELCRQLLGLVAPWEMGRVAGRPVWGGPPWPTTSRTLGDDLLMCLPGVGSNSLHRYRRGERPTPDAVAERLHVVMQIVSDLSGSYNVFGIRGWFHRPRVQLRGAAPVDLLAGASSADDEATGRVQELARTLTGAGV